MSLQGWKSYTCPMFSQGGKRIGSGLQAKHHQAIEVLGSKQIVGNHRTKCFKQCDFTKTICFPIFETDNQMILFQNATKKPKQLISSPPIGFEQIPSLALSHLESKLGIVMGIIVCQSCCHSRLMLARCGSEVFFYR